MMPKLCIVMGMSGNQSSQGTITDTEQVHWIILTLTMSRDLTRSRLPFWKLIYETLFGITDDQVNCKFRIYKFVVGGGLAQHDDVIKWEHFPRHWPFVRGIHRSPVNSPHRVQWRRALIFALICARINGWVNNREAGDLRRHRAHYDVRVMVRCYM